MRANPHLESRPSYYNNLKSKFYFLMMTSWTQYYSLVPDLDTAVAHDVYRKNRGNDLNPQASTLAESLSFTIEGRYLLFY